MLLTVSRTVQPYGYVITSKPYEHEIWTTKNKVFAMGFSGKLPVTWQTVGATCGPLTPAEETRWIVAPSLKLSYLIAACLIQLDELPRMRLTRKAPDRVQQALSIAQLQQLERVMGTMVGVKAFRVGDTAMLGGYEVQINQLIPEAEAAVIYSQTLGVRSLPVTELTYPYEISRWNQFQKETFDSLLFQVVCDRVVKECRAY